MTTKKDLKTLIRQRMTRTGEKYSVARQHILTASNKLCPACNTTLEERTVRQMIELPEDGLDDITEGQAADYFQALDSNDPGDWGEWAEDVVEKFCPRCEARIAAVNEMRRGRRSNSRAE